MVEWKNRQKRSRIRLWCLAVLASPLGEAFRATRGALLPNEPYVRWKQGTSTAKDYPLKGTRSDRAWKLESPVVALHDAAQRVLEVALPQESEADLAAMAFDGPLSTDGNA